MKSQKADCGWREEAQQKHKVIQNIIWRLGPLERNYKSHANRIRWMTLDTLSLFAHDARFAKFYSLSWMGVRWWGEIKLIDPLAATFWSLSSPTHTESVQNARAGFCFSQLSSSSPLTWGPEKRETQLFQDFGGKGRSSLARQQWVKPRRCVSCAARVHPTI